MKTPCVFILTKKHLEYAWLTVSTLKYVLYTDVLHLCTLMAFANRLDLNQRAPARALLLWCALFDTVL